MQCANCDFENIPGVPRCVRCQSILDLADVDIWPPRAGRYRIASRARRAWNPIHQGVTWMPTPHALPAVRIPWQPVAWSAIPGLGHIRYNDRKLGWFLLVCWLVCFPLMLGSIGLPLNGACVALAVLIHALAILSLVSVQLTRSLATSRALFGVFLFACLWAFVYRPAGGFFQHLYVPLTVRGIWANSLVDAGDTLLCQGPWLRPRAFRRGDLVVYRPAGRQTHGGSAEDGFGVDRIVGVPGDVLRIEGGRISVNGQAVRAASVPAGAIPPGVYERTVDPGQYMIVQSAARFAGPASAAAGPELADLCLVSQGDVLGRVVVRINPLWRFGPVR